MTLRVRLLTLTLPSVGAAAVLLLVLNLNSLAATSLKVAISSSEIAGRQLQSFILWRLSEVHPNARAKPADIKKLWSRNLASDAGCASFLAQLTAQSPFIAGIDVADENGEIVTSTNQGRTGAHIAAQPDLQGLRGAAPWTRMSAILASHNDYETRVPLGMTGETSPVFTIQILTSPASLRTAILPGVGGIVFASGIALALAFGFSYWSASGVLHTL